MTDNLHACAHCGQLVDETCTVNVDGTIEQWCDERIDADACYCEHCDQYRIGETQTVYHNGHPQEWCEECVSATAIECDCCGDLTDENDCENVYVYDVGRQTICNSCLDNYYQCAKCGDYCTEDDVVYHDDRYYCASCDPLSYIDSYHHTEGVSFLRVDSADTAPYLGVELEMEFPNNNARAEAARSIRTDTRYGHLYECKVDSSLEDYGLECVTQPATLLYHMQGYDNRTWRARKARYSSLYGLRAADYYDWHTGYYDLPTYCYGRDAYELCREEGPICDGY